MMIIKIFHTMRFSKSTILLQWFYNVLFWDGWFILLYFIYEQKL